MSCRLRLAPDLEVSHWLNTPQPLSLQSLRGRVVLIEAFQMLCPACVSHGLPQASRVAEAFSREQVAVLGLHTVFEHHAAQGTPETLKAFLHEYRITFPIGIDAPSQENGPPRTMTAYGMRGTPSLILIDRQGRIRKHGFGIEQDLRLGADIMALLSEDRGSVATLAEPQSERDTGQGCPIPDASWGAM